MVCSSDIFKYFPREIEVATLWGVAMQEDIKKFFEDKKPSGLFSKFLAKNPLFKNKDVLSGSYIPKKIYHRDEQINQIASILAPALRGQLPNNIFIYGTVGTGKSITTKYVVSELSKSSDRVKVIYINCKMKRVSDTEYRLLSQILQEFNIIVPDTGLPTEVLYKKFFEALDSRRRIVVLVLDEIDNLIKKIGDNFLYNLTRINTELRRAKMSIIGITNDIAFRESLDARVKSSLSEEEVLFSPYNAIQLKDILTERVKEAFYDGVVSESIINKCAAIAAQEHGDARRALDLLRVAGELAEREGSEKVEERHVDAAQDKLDMDRVTEIIKNQPRQSKAVLYAIIKAGKNNVMTGDVLEKYREICLSNGLNVLTQRRVSDLITEYDMLGIITTKIVSKGRYGRTREISLEMDGKVFDTVVNMLREEFG